MICLHMLLCALMEYSVILDAKGLKLKLLILTIDRQDGAMLVVMNIWMIGRDNSAKEDDGGVEKVHE